MRKVRAILLMLGVSLLLLMGSVTQAAETQTTTSSVTTKKD